MWILWIYVSSNIFMTLKIHLSALAMSPYYHIRPVIIGKDLFCLYCYKKKKKKVARDVGKKVMKHAALSPSLSVKPGVFAKKMWISGPEEAQWCRTEGEVLIVFRLFTYLRKQSSWEAFECLRISCSNFSADVSVVIFLTGLPLLHLTLLCELVWIFALWQYQSD